VTAVLAEGRTLEEALIECWSTLPGRAACAPAHAPFTRLARAKTEEAARRFEDCIDRARTRYDHVVLDVPPVASNEAVAAVTRADRRVLVAPATRRGADLVPTQRGRLVDVGADVEAVVANRANGTDPAATPLPAADFAIPAGDSHAVVPTCIAPDETSRRSKHAAAAACFDRRLDLEFPSEGLFG
jgi:hypothetical protein